MDLVLKDSSEEKRLGVKEGVVEGGAGENDGLQGRDIWEEREDGLLELRRESYKRIQRQWCP